MNGDLIVNSTPALARWLLVGIGLVFVALAAVGAMLPVMPTTIFLICAIACFARSSPRLERKLLRNRLFAPYMRYIDGNEPLPRRVRIMAMSAMWCCVLTSFTVIMLTHSARSPFVSVLLLVLGLIATVAIACWQPDANASAGNRFECPHVREGEPASASDGTKVSD